MPPFTPSPYDTSPDPTSPYETDTDTSTHINTHLKRTLTRSGIITLTILLLFIFFLLIIFLAACYLCRAATFLNWRAHHIAELKAFRAAKKNGKSTYTKKTKDAEDAARKRADAVSKEVGGGCGCDGGVQSSQSGKKKEVRIYEEETRERGEKGEEGCRWA